MGRIRKMRPLISSLSDSSQIRSLGIYSNYCRCPEMERIFLSKELTHPKDANGLINSVPLICRSSPILSSLHRKKEITSKTD